MEPTARETFNQLNPSTRRQAAYWVDSSKGLDVRAKRAAEMLRRLLSGQFMIGGQKIKVSETSSLKNQAGSETIN
ncbi:MAG: YdeI/OmpD-associated family protein [Cytophagaceae bacterium]|nr:YdeI/OmpD-associated family protein [Cytophagaceae bacterium]